MVGPSHPQFCKQLLLGMAFTIVSSLRLQMTLAPCLLLFGKRIWGTATKQTELSICLHCRVSLGTYPGVTPDPSPIHMQHALT